MKRTLFALFIAAAAFAAFRPTPALAQGGCASGGCTSRDCSSGGRCQSASNNDGRRGLLDAIGLADLGSAFWQASAGSSIGLARFMQPSQSPPSLQGQGHRSGLIDRMGRERSGVQFASGQLPVGGGVVQATATRGAACQCEKCKAARYHVVSGRRTLWDRVADRFVAKRAAPYPPRHASRPVPTNGNPY